MALDVFDVTVASSTRMPTASARPPRVMTLIVSPRELRTMTDVRIESGIDTAMIKVLRQLPRKTKIMMAVRHAAMTASRITPLLGLSPKLPGYGLAGRPSNSATNNVPGTFSLRNHFSSFPLFRPKSRSQSPPAGATFFEGTSFPHARPGRARRPRGSQGNRVRKGTAALFSREPLFLVPSG
jgi:hypothetical protein